MEENNKLMQRVAKDDEIAFQELMINTLPMAHAFVSRMLQNPTLSDDLVQEGYFRVWLNRHKWQAKANFKTWFFKILYNLCMDFFRDVSKQNVYQTDLIKMSMEDTLETELLNNEQSEIFNMAIQSIKPNEKAILFMFYYHGIKQTEIAQMLNMSISAVESSLFRTRQYLKKVIQ